MCALSTKTRTLSASLSYNTTGLRLTTNPTPINPFGGLGHHSHVSSVRWSAAGDLDCRGRLNRSGSARHQSHEGSASPSASSSPSKVAPVALTPSSTAPVVLMDSTDAPSRMALVRSAREKSKHLRCIAVAEAGAAQAGARQFGVKEPGEWFGIGAIEADAAQVLVAEIGPRNRTLAGGVALFQFGPAFGRVVGVCAGFHAGHGVVGVAALPASSNRDAQCRTPRARSSGRARSASVMVWLFSASRWAP